MLGIKALLWDLLALWPLVFSFTFLFSKLGADRMKPPGYRKDRISSPIYQIQMGCSLRQALFIESEFSRVQEYPGPCILVVTMQGVCLEKSLANSRHTIHSAPSPLLWATACRHLEHSGNLLKLRM